MLLRIFLFCLLAFVSPIISDKATPEWSKVYSVKGVLSIPYAELKEPFYVWYDEVLGASRIDYYGGMAETYQLSPKLVGNYGSNLKVVPVTTDTQLNVKSCLQVNGSEDSVVFLQSIFPDMKDFKFISEESFRGGIAEKWSLSQKIDDKTNTYTMWVKYRKESDQNDQNDVAIPIRYEMRGFNNLLGSHYDHYYLDYEDYNVEEISADVFKPKMQCGDFPGPGNAVRYTFNPAREFVYPTSTEHVDNEFNRFVNKHGRKFSQEEHTKRKELFRQNLRFIHSKNRENKGYSLAVNHLADRTDDERKVLCGRRYSTENNGALPFPYNTEELSKNDVPPSIDWRIWGAVTPVKDQSVCGSCWSFGSIGAIEGALFLHTGHLIRLSQQALIDCSWGYGNNGCDGGEDFRVFQWMMKHGGVPSEDEYGRYLGQDGYCHIDKVPMVAPIKGYVNVTSNDADALKFAIFKHGPISVAIDASHKSFSFYSHGVYYEPKCGNKLTELDHAVLAVGYGNLNGEDYWLIKNSWSNYWGNDGYVLMAARDNNCGVQTTPTYVVM